MTPFNRTRQFVLFIALFALAVVGLGAYTRLKNAGLGCPDWPGCYGQLWLDASKVAHPIETEKAWTEMIHRYAASTLGLFILALNCIAYRFRKQPIFPKKMIFTLLVLVIFQGLLGMWTVTLKLLPLVVMLHLLGGFLTFSLLCCVWQKLNKPVHVLTRPSFLKLARFSLFILFLQILLGAWTSTNYAALACPDFPTCQGSVIPATFDFKQAFNLWPVGPNGYEFGVLDNAARMTIHWLHRVNALIVAALLMIFSVKGINQKTTLTKSFYWVMGLLFVQIGLGIANVLTHLALPVAVFHNIVALLLGVTVLLINTRLYSKS